MDNPSSMDDALPGPTRLAFFTPVHHQPVMADRKAAFLITGSGIIATAMALFAEAIASLVRSPHLAISIGTLLLLFGLVAVLATCAWSCWCGFTLPLPPAPASLANFSDIVRLPYEEYRGAMLGTDLAQARRHVLHYNHSLAVLAVAKYRRVRLAQSCFRLALMLWSALMLLISVSA